MLVVELCSEGSCELCPRQLWDLRFLGIELESHSRSRDRALSCVLDSGRTCRHAERCRLPQAKAKKDAEGVDEWDGPVNLEDSTVPEPASTRKKASTVSPPVPACGQEVVRLLI